jgi:hypothetical protein
MRWLQWPNHITHEPCDDCSLNSSLSCSLSFPLAGRSHFTLLDSMDALMRRHLFTPSPPRDPALVPSLQVVMPSSSIPAPHASFKADGGRLHGRGKRRAVRPSEPDMSQPGELASLAKLGRTSWWLVFAALCSHPTRPIVQRSGHASRGSDALSFSCLLVDDISFPVCTLALYDHICSAALLPVLSTVTAGVCLSV